MYFDEVMFRIIAQSFNWNEAETQAFMQEIVGNSFSIIIDRASIYMEEKLPGRLEELEDAIGIDENGNLKAAKNAEDAIKRYQIFVDQMLLLTNAYPELTKKITDDINYLQKGLFLEFLKNGPDEGRIAIMNYLIEKLDEVSKIPEILEKIKDMTRDKEIQEVLGGPIFAEKFNLLNQSIDQAQ